MHLGASQVAAALVAGEAAAPLSYRGVALAVEAVDARAVQIEAQPPQLYRVFVVDVVSWPRLDLPARYQRPQRWRSEAQPVYDEQPSTLAARLQGFEATFALRTFLYRVEADIDSVLTRAEESAAAWLQRRDCAVDEP